MPARIVVAHDDPEFLEGTVLALRDAGYDLLLAGTVCPLSMRWMPSLLSC
jgi:hypothetical protein